MTSNCPQCICFFVCLASIINILYLTIALCLNCWWHPLPFLASKGRFLWMCSDPNDDGFCCVLVVYLVPLCTPFDFKDALFCPYISLIVCVFRDFESMVCTSLF